MKPNLNINKSEQIQQFPNKIDTNPKCIQYWTNSRFERTKSIGNICMYCINVCNTMHQCTNSPTIFCYCSNANPYVLCVCSFCSSHWRGRHMAIWLFNSWIGCCCCWILFLISTPTTAFHINLMHQNWNERIPKCKSKPYNFNITTHKKTLPLINRKMNAIQQEYQIFEFDARFNEKIWCYVYGVRRIISELMRKNQ